jgi:hypothetical protein
MATKINHGAIAGAVAITTLLTLIVFGIAVAHVKSSYRQRNHLPDVEYRAFFGGTYSEAAPVAFSDLDAGDIGVLVLVIVLFPVVHAGLGRVIAELIQALCSGVSEIYGLTGEDDIAVWSAEGKLMTGVLWPITSLSLPLLIIAIVLGLVYRFIWKTL